MSDVEWPPELPPRTPAGERKHSSPFSASIADTTAEIAKEMRLLGADNWRFETASGGGHTKKNGLPKASANPDDPAVVIRWTLDGEPHAAGCDSFGSLRDNCRELLLWLNDTRMGDGRNVATAHLAYAQAALPGPDEDAIAVGQSPHDVLGVSPDATDDEIRGAFRAQVKDTHPDYGGSSEEFRRLKDAKDALLG